MKMQCRFFFLYFHVGSFFLRLVFHLSNMIIMNRAKFEVKIVLVKFSSDLKIQNNTFAKSITIITRNSRTNGTNHDNKVNSQRCTTRVCITSQDLLLKWRGATESRRPESDISHFSQKLPYFYILT